MARRIVSGSVWHPLIGAMSASAGAAAASAFLSAAATKILAITLGPASIAVLSTLQQIRQTALVAATANGQTALVQGASAFEAARRREYLRTAGGIFCASTAAVILILALAPEAAARWAGLRDSGQVRGLGIAIAFSSLFVYEGALLNAAGAIGALALLQLAGPGMMALLAWPFASRGWYSALLAAAAGASAGAALAALVLRRNTLAGWFSGSGRRWSWRAATHFLSLSGAMLTTGLAASGALVTVRSWILRGEGLNATGQFDAAWGISMNQVSLVLASVQTYYLPLLSRCRRAEERGKHIGRVLSLAAPAAALVIVLITASKRFILVLLYSKAFAPAEHYLRWTLLGDYLKVASWILSVPMLAAADLKIFLAADLAATGAFLAGAAALRHWRTPAESAAMAFVVMHVVHLAICASYAIRRHAFRLASGAVAIWIAGLFAVGAASVLTWS